MYRFQNVIIIIGDEFFFLFLTRFALSPLNFYHLVGFRDLYTARIHVPRNYFDLFIPLYFTTSKTSKDVIYPIIPGIRCICILYAQCTSLAAPKRWNGKDAESDAWRSVLYYIHLRRRSRPREIFGTFYFEKWRFVEL